MRPDHWLSEHKKRLLYSLSRLSLLACAMSPCRPAGTKQVSNSVMPFGQKAIARHNIIYSALAGADRSKSACADNPPDVSNGCCQDLRPFQPLSFHHGIVDPVISPKQNCFLEDEGGHLPDFSIATRA